MLAKVIKLFEHLKNKLYFIAVIYIKKRTNLTPYFMNRLTQSTAITQTIIAIALPRRLRTEFFTYI